MGSEIQRSTTPTLFSGATLHNDVAFGSVLYTAWSWTGDRPLRLQTNNVAWTFGASSGLAASTERAGMMRNTLRKRL
jgi:hypothetical protein